MKTIIANKGYTWEIPGGGERSLQKEIAFTLFYLNCWLLNVCFLLLLLLLFNTCILIRINWVMLCW